MNSLKGSEVAKSGFRNEKNILNKFLDYKNDVDAQLLLEEMGYDFNKIITLDAQVLSKKKADIQLYIVNEDERVPTTENIQVKLIHNVLGYNQIDKRWIDAYAKLWDIPRDIVVLLKHFTGENEPYRDGVKDTRRMFMTDFTLFEQNKILNWFNQNKAKILSDIIKGNGEMNAEWILITKKTNHKREYLIKKIESVIDYYDVNEFLITPRGSLKIGGITMQRKGGDAGRKTANMLQFKMRPGELFLLE